MLHRLLPPNQKEAPRKRLRGLKRYFRGVFSKVEAFELDVSEGAWYDFWHYHPDWYGYGNRSWSMRARHLEALAKMFARSTQQLTQLNRPYQLWMYLDAHDSSQDAVYVHSSNPHSEFPLVADWADWGLSDVSTYFECLLPGFRFRAGRWGNSGLYVYSPDVGISLEEVKPSLSAVSIDEAGDLVQSEAIYVHSLGR